MDSVLTSLTIPSRFYLLGLWAVGVLSRFHFFRLLAPSLTHPRCTGHRTDLDEDGALPHTEQLTLASVEAFTYKELWEDYGIVADVSVCYDMS
jgi:hypothetical protein